MTWLPGSVSGACRPVPRSPRPPPLAPPTPRPVAQLRSRVSQLLWRGLTSRLRASSASARRLPDADRPPHATAKVEISRFPDKERPHMPGSRTAQDRTSARDSADPRVAFRWDKGVGVLIDYFAAQWLAYAYPCRR